MIDYPIYFGRAIGIYKSMQMGSYTHVSGIAEFEKLELEYLTEVAELSHHLMTEDAQQLLLQEALYDVPQVNPTEAEIDELDRLDQMKHKTAHEI